MGLFKKKPAIEIKDRIWVTTPSKLDAFKNETEKTPGIVFILWFDETLKSVESFFSQQAIKTAILLTAKESNRQYLEGKRVIFGEHYPLREKEIELFQNLKLNPVEVWSALDEPLFMRFGSEKIVGLLSQLGMKDNQPIEHQMISKAIQKVQDKISNNVTNESLATSQSDWMQRNLSS